MKQRKYVSVVFDRKHEMAKSGIGRVELLIVFSKTERKYLSLRKCTMSEWKQYEKSAELAAEVHRYTSIVMKMEYSGEEMTREVFESHTGMDILSKAKKIQLMYASSPTGFIQFIKDVMEKEELAKSTRQKRKVSLRAIESWGKINRLSDITEQNILAFDEWLHDGTRTTVTIHNYHSMLGKYTRLARERGYIKVNPYELSTCRFSKGKYKERRPLTEDELLKIRKLRGLSPKLERARDIFVFCAYTGLAYIDSQNFNFETMTEEHEGTFYIDGSRIKTDNQFFTPILPPAMAVLKKYNYNLPHISNQKLNDHLHDLEDKAGIHKPITTHVARHSFATLVLSYDVPIENVARMMGHTNIKTTQIYAKILKSTIERHVRNLNLLIR